MADFWLPLLLAVSAVWVLRAWRARRFGNKARKAATYTYPPGLEPYPLIGHLPQFLANRHRVLDWMTEALERQPTATFVLRRPGGVRGAVTANPANVEHFLRASFDNYPKGPKFASLLHDFLGRGIFNADGEAWRAQRKVASHEFNTRSLRAFVARCVHSELHGRLLPLLRRAAASGAGARLDLQDVLERFAFDNICRVAFDHDPRQLLDDGDDGTAADGSFADAFRDAANLSAGRFRYAVPGFWKIKKALNVGSERRLRESIAMVHDFADRIIQSRREEMLRDGFGKHDLLSRFMASQDGTYSESEVPPPRRRDQLPPCGAGDHVLGAHLVLLAALLAPRRAAPHPRGGRGGARPARTGRRRHHRRLRPRRAPRDALRARGHHGVDASLPAGSGELAAGGDGRRPPRRHGRAGGLVRGVQLVRDGADGVGLGPRRAGVPAGAVAEPRRRDVPAGQPVPVRGVPRRAEGVPGQGDGVHSDEVHRGMRAGGARRGRRRRVQAPAGRVADVADGGRAPRDREAETKLLSCLLTTHLVSGSLQTSIGSSEG